MSWFGQDELDALTTTLQAGEEGSFELLASLEDKGQISNRRLPKVRKQPQIKVKVVVFHSLHGLALRRVPTPMNLSYSWL